MGERFWWILDSIGSISYSKAKNVGNVNGADNALVDLQIQPFFTVFFSLSIKTVDNPSAKADKVLELQRIFDEERSVFYKDEA